ncbi:MAG TPA: selenocysteine-specific translation elongation factor, partial [Deltaproteobacteria bacterium]|nr:selenocysteine-specific translation elongation factor [Deltaproteobacteria bacterium]
MSNLASSPTTDVLVVGTAGHIDHGKTSLVRALTGRDLDRLPEERARGITIALGFTNLTLPSGRVASLVDVPGHERLVRTMIAGATGLDAVLFCVSAVEGVMPQTREHLAILELLGVEHGFVVLTMTDLVDDELAELAELDVEETVMGTFLEGAPILRTAAGPHPRGIDAVQAALDALAPATRRDSNSPFRLPVDRAFVQKGFGTVVTGTMRGGTIKDGAEVELLPAGHRCRIRGLQVHGAAQGQSRAGLRTALNLAGIERDDLARGHVVCTPGMLTARHIIDAQIELLEDSPPLPAGSRVRVLAGTAETLAVFAPIAAQSSVEDPSTDPSITADLMDPWPPGGHGFVQLRTDHPIVVLPGDRLILRRESPVTTLGGGVVLDPWAPRVRRKTRARHAVELARLHRGETDILLHRAGDQGLDAAGVALRQTGPGVRLADRHVHPDRVDRLTDALLLALRRWHEAHPLADGAPRRDLHGAALSHLPTAVFDALVARVAADGRVALEGPRLRAADFAVQLSRHQQGTWNQLVSELDGLGPSAPKFPDILSRAPELVALMLSRRILVR